ncbi:toll/interleukin-1 receptor domain-containing protein [Paenibacillus lutimineralis]|uniref:Toll/interleukin-1 receptor domain-containing protein n=1 Tax=Paenibacillus lutimineralis TaxID=2707005 RepID=A0A3Q9I9R3_9BACL|nr:toll/interleukin-1 receptor domain-containing protein [Paenibacillus lutimineralis]AZS14327.1 toll/interleukin-1 receptor domain-containing protein [Paenibacillus lutimineralis]
MRTILIYENAGELEYSFNGNEDWHETDGISIDFLFKKGTLHRELIDKVINLSKNIDWIKIEGRDFFFDLKKLKATSEIFSDCLWLDGTIHLSYTFDKSMNDEEIVCFTSSKEEIEINMPKKIFLSHRGLDKPLVREYHKLLLELGYEPWLDEEDMAAGAKLHRGILQGMKDSCAAVFFVTPNYIDDGYLEIEIDQAVNQKVKKKNRFAIITLSLPDENGKRGVVPDLLQDFVWKQPSSHLVAFTEIIKALPLINGIKMWKD